MPCHHHRSSAAPFSLVAALATLALALGPGLTGCDLPPVAAAPSGSGASTRSVALIVAPDDGTSAILTAIRSARRRVLVQMYMLTAPDALAALVTAHDAGADVRVLLEPATYGTADANQPAFLALAAAGIDVRWIGRPKGLVHTKLVLVDDSVAYIMTLNLTASGLGSNREYIIVDSDPANLRRLQVIWNADAIGGDPGPVPSSTRLLTSPIDARSRLTSAIDGARTTIGLEIEEISDADLVSRLIAARERGVAVTVVAPAGNTSAATAAALGRMATAGITVRTVAAPAIHAKAMVVDGRRVYVGSVNFTRASLDDNREIGVLLDAPAMAARISATIAADAARGLAP